MSNKFEKDTLLQSPDVIKHLSNHMILPMKILFMKEVKKAALDYIPEEHKEVFFELLDKEFYYASFASLIAYTKIILKEKD